MQDNIFDGNSIHGCFLLLGKKTTTVPATKVTLPSDDSKFVCALLYIESKMVFI